MDIVRQAMTFAESLTHINQVMGFPKSLTNPDRRRLRGFRFAIHRINRTLHHSRARGTFELLPFQPLAPSNSCYCRAVPSRID